MSCNYCFPTGTIFQINSEFWKKGTFRWENRTSCLVGLKTHRTIVPRSGIELTTSRLHSFINAKVSHALSTRPWRRWIVQQRIVHLFMFVSKVLDELAQYDSNGRVPNRGIMPMMRDRCMWCGMPYFGGGTHSMEILTVIIYASKAPSFHHIALVLELERLTRG